ncbi:hypothetical protein [Halomonas salina]|uniref:hypothetical protein n=1 Tax=Halomonas salina TaxID=42565 RepID=UPI000A7E4EAD|nr:hypothetical protein [Halomonas salina]
MATPKTTPRKTRSTKAAQPQAQEAKTEEAKAAEAPKDDQAETAAPNADDSAQAPEAGQTDAGEQAAATQAPAPSGQGDDAKGAAKDAKERRDQAEIPALFVRTKRRFKSRRRAGFRFTREGLGIARSALTDEQVEQLQADPALEVEECTFPAEDDGEPEA